MYCNVNFCKLKLEKLFSYKILIFLISLLGSLFLISNNFPVDAATIDNFTDDDTGFTYSIDTDTNIATVTSYDNRNAAVEIPDTVAYENEDYNVTKIGAKAFFDNSEITSVKGDSITRIEGGILNGSNDYDGVFGGCANLFHVDFENLIYVGTHAFADCPNLSEVSLPKATYIGNYLFRNCTNLGKIVTDLKTIELPNATFLGENVFFNSGVERILLQNASYIGQKAFRNCNNLKVVNAPRLVYCHTGIFFNLSNSTPIEFTAPKIMENYSALKNNRVINNWIDNNFDIDPVKTATNNILDISYKDENNKDKNGTKIEEIKDALSATHGNVAINAKILGNYPVSSVGNSKYYAVQFYPSSNRLDEGIAQHFTDIVYLVELMDVSTTITDTELTYNGSAQIPTVTIKDGDNFLTRDTDYQIICDDNTNAGIKNLTVKYLGNYSKLDDEVHSFTILKANIDPFTINISKKNNYTGNPVKLILSIGNEVNFEMDNGPKLYLRIADHLNDLPSSDNPWILYSNANTLENANLKKTSVGTYYIYYYVDGGINYNDLSGSLSP